MSEQILAAAKDRGLVVEQVAKLLERAQKEVNEGLLPAAQIALAKDGELVFQASYGSAKDDSLTCIFSATKAITSAAAWLLMQEGKLSESEIVADIIPEFAANEKDQITVEQLFTHTAGFPSAPFAPLDWDDKEARLGRFTRWRLNWEPGSKFEYHASSSMYVIAELIERRSGMGYREFVRNRVLGPLGLKNLFVGLPASENARALPCEHVGDALTPEDYKKLGVPVPPVTEVTEEAILAFNRPDVRAVGVPGGGGFATAGDLALFHQALLHGGLPGSEELWPESTRTNVRRIRSGDFTDMLFKKPANRALGLIISGDDSRSFRGFGKSNSPDAFGHNGAGGQLAWADPATGLSLGYVTPGHDRNNIRQGSRGVAISSIAAQCAPLL
ncbi:MAG: class A beta-lactamase-related serine hydrolase [Gammaproteobacteria bacterium TMED92]|nr:MAG: class A beta-lactamase-related serine hydrolase [Gammaproteobacteria bacterium TMED92]